MPEPIVTQCVVWQGSDAVLLDRVRSVDGTYVQQSYLSAVTLTVRDTRDDMAIVYGPLSLSTAAVIFNTLQHDDILWPVDDIGFNFKYRLAGALAFPSDSTYRIDVILTLVDGTTFPLQFEATALPVP